MAESLAQTLVAKIFVIAFEEAAEKLCKIPIIFDNEEEDINNKQEIIKDKSTTLKFINNEDLFTIIETQPLIINAKYSGEKCRNIQWYLNNEIIEPKRYIC